MPKEIEIVASPNPWDSKVTIGGEVVRGVRNFTLRASFEELTQIALEVIRFDGPAEIIRGVLLPEEEYKAWFHLTEEELENAYSRYITHLNDPELKEYDHEAFKRALRTLTIVPERLTTHQEHEKEPDLDYREEIVSALLRGIGGVEKAREELKSGLASPIRGSKYMNGMFDLRGVAAILAFLGDETGIDYFRRERKRNAYDPLQNGGHRPNKSFTSECVKCSKPWPCPTVLDIETGRK